MADPFIAEIRIFPFNFAPTGWALCNGQILPISQNTALFSLLGTTYGGDGRSNFALPNLQGSVPMHPGQGPGLTLHELGETGGTDTVTLLPSELPSHRHAIECRGTPPPASGGVPGPSAASGRSNGGMAYTTAANLVQLDPVAVAPAGGGQPHNNLMPYLTLTFAIALQGVFPARS